MPKMKSSIGSALRKQVKKSAAVWTGPNGEGRNGGVTQGLLSRWLSCRERTRVLLVEGLKPADAFNPRIEFGSLWHLAEEAHAGGINWEQSLQEYGRNLCQRYPFQQEQIDHWYRLTKAMFPVYVDCWARHADVNGRVPLLQEQAFDVPHTLPSGRTVRLRGKWDAVDFLPAREEDGFEYPAGIWLGENKTKSSIDPQKIQRHLNYDLQVMLYLVALTEWKPSDDVPHRDRWINRQIIGVRYNVVRRPAHKTPESAMKKLTEDLQSGRGGEWFGRWKARVSPTEVSRFRKTCLDPILEQLCDWAQTILPDGKCKVWGGPENLNYRTPYHYDPISEGGSGDLDNFLDTGSETGLQRTNVLFPELEPNQE